MVSIPLSWKLKDRKFICENKPLQTHTYTSYIHTYIFHIYYFPYSLPESTGKVIAKLCWATHSKEAQPFLGVEADREQGSRIWQIFPIKVVSIHGLSQQSRFKFWPCLCNLKNKAKQSGKNLP